MDIDWQAVLDPTTNPDTNFCRLHWIDLEHIANGIQFNLARVIVAWAVIFAVVHVYWAAGGDAGQATRPG